MTFSSASASTLGALGASHWQCETVDGTPVYVAVKHMGNDK